MIPNVPRTNIANYIEAVNLKIYADFNLSGYFR